MKSLEHIIREIREGKGVKGEKSSLEHSIRKVVKGEAESSFADRTTKPLDEVVGTLGTDKYQGNEFKSIRTATPHIKPPAGEGSHSQAPENASRQRSIAKEKAGINRVTEEDLQELQAKVVKEPEVLSRAMPKAAAPIAKAAAPIVKAGAKAVIGRAAGVLLGPEAMAGGLLAPYVSARYKEQHKGGLIPHPETPGVDAATSFERMKGFKVAPPKPAETRPKPETKPAEVAPKTEPKPETAPKTEPKPEEKPKVAPTPATEPATTPATDTKPKIAVLPKIDVPADTKPATETTPKTMPAEPASKTPETATTTTAPKPKLPPVSGASVPHDIDYTVSHLVRPGISRGHAKAHKKHAMKEENERKQIENMPRKGDRKSIEYVGRKDADPKSTKEKTSRLATIKNVIDEARKAMVDKKFNPEDGKTKVYDYGDNVLVINPDQRKINLDVDNGEKIAKDYENK
jgi:hypothetical protein